MADDGLFVYLIERPPIPSFCLGAQLPCDGFKRLPIPSFTFGAQPKAFVLNPSWEEIAPPKVTITELPDCDDINPGYDKTNVLQQDTTCWWNKQLGLATCCCRSSG